MNSQFLPGAATETLVTSYNPWLIILSYLIAAFGAYISLLVAEIFLEDRAKSEKRLLNIVGAFVLGCAIWSMHFVGMLAYQTNMLMHYDTGITIFSFILAVSCAYAAFWIVRRGELSTQTLFPGAVLLGLGIAGMHYAGMAAMEMDARLSYKPIWFAASFVIAIITSGAALWLFFNVGRLPLERRAWGRVGAAAVMGIAISGMHYTGMMGAVIAPFADCRYTNNQNFHGLPLSVAMATGLIFAIGIVLAIAARERRGAEKAEAIFPGHLVSLGLGLTLLAILWLGGSNIYSQRIIRAETANSVQASEISYDIVRLDARQSRFARRMLKNDRALWAPAYEQTAAELQSTLRAIGTNYPGLPLDGEGKNFLLRMTDARAQMNKLEQRALTLGEQKKMKEADDILDGADFAAAKDEYQRGAKEFNDVIIGKSRASLQDVVTRMYFNMYPVLVSILILSLVWYFVFRALQAWRRETDLARIDLEKAKLVAEKASAAKSDFLANMSHEIRSPMNAIMGLSQILLKTPLNSEQQNFAGIIHKSGENLLAILNDILDFSKINAGKLTLEKEPFDLARLATDVTDLFSLPAAEKGVRLGIVFEPAVPQFLIGDAVRIRQILTNFVSNAVKFTQSGEVFIKASVAPRTGNDVDLTLAVHDTGIGIPADKLDSVFEKFTQVEENTTRTFGGTGLGLAICRSLAALMRGRVNVTSVEGKGSVFSVTLPLTIAPSPDYSIYEPNDESDALPPVQKTFPGCKVLIVDDMEINQVIMKKFLEPYACEINYATDGAEALEKMNSAEYDLVFMDCQMPVMDGFEATRAIRAARPRLPNSPIIIALTADAMTGDREKCIAAGMNDYINKPFKAEQIDELMKKWL